MRAKEGDEEAIAGSAGWAEEPRGPKGKGKGAAPEVEEWQTWIDYTSPLLPAANDQQEVMRSATARVVGV